MFFLGAAVGVALGFICGGVAKACKQDPIEDEYIESLIREDKFKQEVIRELDEIYGRGKDVL